ncbi:unnamed protein product, partial [Mesorhabditis spiculigera]
MGAGAKAKPKEREGLEERWSTTLTTGQTKSILLIGQSSIYLIAFASLFWQIPGLYGEKGITPIAPHLQCEEANILNCRSVLLMLLQKYVPMAPSLSMALLVLSAMVLSLITIAFQSARTSFSYFLIWLAYVAVYEVGGTFLWFQWDSLLLESGFLAVILAAFNDGPADQVAIYLYRWLACRLMFASGVVKLQSNCPTWWGLTALEVHYESQCIPTPIAWYFHHLPGWFNRFAVALTFYIELYLPPLFLVPFESVRWFAGVNQILFMGLIMLTGNYNFFNLLYSLICVALLEVGPDNTQREKRQSMLMWLVETIVFVGTVAASLWHFCKWFSVEADWSRRVVDSEIAFDRSEFDAAVRLATEYLIYVGAAGLFWKVFVALWRNGKSFFNILHLTFVVAIGGFIFAVSLVPFTQLDRSVAAKIPPQIRQLHELTSKFHLVNSYGLFRSMTGLEGRPEIVLEGSDGPSGPWKEIEFYAKPGNLNRSPPFVVPHQPRLDWQMWFAALGTYQQNPWFVSMVHQLLNNNTNVVRLLEKYPFTKDQPMKFARAHMYIYHYSKWNGSGWWTRDFQGEYMPTLTRNAEPILDFLAKQKLITVFVWSVLSTVPLILITKRILGF